MYSKLSLSNLKNIYFPYNIFLFILKANMNFFPCKISIFATYTIRHPWDHHFALTVAPRRLHRAQAHLFAWVLHLGYNALA